MTENILEKREVTIYEAAQFLNVHPGTIRKWVSDGKIEIISFPNRKIHIPIGELLRLQKERKIEFIVDEHEIVDFSTLSPEKQIELIGTRIDYLELDTEESRLENEIKSLEEKLRVAKKQQTRIQQTKRSISTYFLWPNYFYNFSIKNIPSILKEERFKTLLKYNLLENPYIKGDTSNENDKNNNRN